MYGYFDFEAIVGTSKRRMLVVFCATSTPSFDDVRDVVRNRLDSSFAPDGIIVLGLETERPEIEQIAADSRLFDHLPLHLRDTHGSIVPVTIPRTGLIDRVATGGGSWAEVKLAGLAKIFNSRNALLIAPVTHHYAKPSKRHADTFIRAANAVVDGAEITFIAACCLPMVPDKLRHIYCDTGGISVVGFAIDSLRRRFDHDCIPATINTFESYTKLNEFEFRECKSSIVLLSASTSGGLVQKIVLREERFTPPQIITLFGHKAGGTGSPVVLDLGSVPEANKVIEESRSYPEDACSLCNRGSLAVPILGDQFIPAGAVTRSVMLKKDHTPDWMLKFLERMTCKQILRAFYRSEGTLHASNDVFIDLQKAFSEEESNKGFLERVDRLFNQSAPAATRRLIYLDDPASKLLAEKFLGYLHSIYADRNRIQLVAASDLEALPPIDLGASLVVAGAVASGHSLIAVSQKLRGRQSNGAISYLVALTRTENPDTLKALETDLRMGKKPSYYSFFSAESIYLPLVGRSARCVWDEELELLQELSDESDEPIRTTLEARIEQLRQSQSSEHRGLCDNLFWPSCREETIKLRHGFVFFPESIAPEKTSQGDVFFAVAAVLHHVRTSKGPKRELQQTEHTRVLLSPVCFDRFSDGVIQASLLRAAKRPELDYTSSPEDSLKMSSVLRSIFANANTPKGEASSA
jgi:hypothetical protein